MEMSPANWQLGI